jgi:DNA-binding IclR family transcriptional regulator
MSSQPNQSLIDGLACLQFLASARKPVGSREMARDLDLDNMRANRLLKTLASIGLAQQDAKKKYSIGPGIHALTAQSLFGSSILKQALPLIQQLPYKGVTVALGVLWRGHVTYLYHGEIGETIEKGIGRIGLVPALNSSIGKLLLSYEDDETIEDLRSSSEKHHLKGPLFKEMKKIRKNSYAEIHPESGGVSLALPIGDPPVMGLALAGVPIEERIEPYLQSLENIRDQISL